MPLYKTFGNIEKTIFKIQTLKKSYSNNKNVIYT